MGAGKPDLTIFGRVCVLFTTEPTLCPWLSSFEWGWVGSDLLKCEWLWFDGKSDKEENAPVPPIFLSLPLLSSWANEVLFVCLFLFHHFCLSLPM